jgi:hypothetical protein
MWEVCIWTTPSKGFRREFKTREEAYTFANSQQAFAIEVYGPNGEYDAVS